MKKHILLLMSVLSITSELAFAGAGTYLKIRNDSNYDAHITSLDSQCWYSNDLQDNVVNAHTVKVLYTELKNSVGCNSIYNNTWYQVFKIDAGALVGEFKLSGYSTIPARHDYYRLDRVTPDEVSAVIYKVFFPSSGTYRGYIEITDKNKFNDDAMHLSADDWN